MLRADEYTDGDLDWYSFDAGQMSDLGAPTTPVPPKAVQPRPMLPTPVRYPGHARRPVLGVRGWRGELWAGSRPARPT